MKLGAINILCIEDIKVMRSIDDILYEEDNTEKEDDAEKKDDGELQTSKKNEGSPAAKAYKSSSMSQQEISNKTGISKAEISKYKSSDPDIHRDPSVKSLEKLSRAGVNIRQMLPNLFK